VEGPVIVLTEQVFNDTPGLDVMRYDPGVADLQSGIPYLLHPQLRMWSR
jgi:hypothetical protein